ncbi:MAG: ATP-binding protein [Bacteroidota bacterium]
MVVGPPDRLTQVLVNLIGNAIKFCPAANGLIAVSLTTETEDDLVRLRIRDNGPGVPPEKHELIFGRFTQISNAQQGKPVGSGLGLYISRTIIENCGGSITVNPNYVDGAEFVILLPLHRSQSNQQPLRKLSITAGLPPKRKHS